MGGNEERAQTGVPQETQRCPQEAEILPQELRIMGSEVSVFQFWTHWSGLQNQELTDYFLLLGVILTDF